LHLMRPFHLLQQNIRVYYQVGSQIVLNLRTVCHER
jgi:hypothetical protein